uniref:Uncharacterized protein n=1 Tax=Brassica campestris TaxID=3711 RepID=M4ETT5_BRACM
MSSDDQNNQQTCNDTTTSNNVNQTPAANVSMVNTDTNTAVLDEFKKMFTTFSKKSEEEDKVISTLSKHVETLTARTRVITSVATRKDSENLPPHEQDADENEIERVNLDPSDQSDHSDEYADVHPRRTWSCTNRMDSSFIRGRIKRLLAISLSWNQRPVVVLSDVKVLVDLLNAKKIDIKLQSVLYDIYALAKPLDSLENINLCVDFVFRNKIVDKCEGGDPSDEDRSWSDGAKQEDSVLFSHSLRQNNARRLIKTIRSQMASEIFDETSINDTEKDVYKHLSVYD